MKVFERSKKKKVEGTKMKVKAVRKIADVHKSLLRARNIQQTIKICGLQAESNAAVERLSKETRNYGRKRHGGHLARFMQARNMKRAIKDWMALKRRGKSCLKDAINATHPGLITRREGDRLRKDYADWLSLRDPLSEVRRKKDWIGLDLRC